MQVLLLSLSLSPVSVPWLTCTVYRAYLGTPESRPPVGLIRQDKRKPGKGWEVYSFTHRLLISPLDSNIFLSLINPLNSSVTQSFIYALIHLLSYLLTHSHTHSFVYLLLTFLLTHSTTFSHTLTHSLTH